MAASSAYFDLKRGLLSLERKGRIKSRNRYEKKTRTECNNNIRHKHEPKTVSFEEKVMVKKKV